MQKSDKARRLLVFDCRASFTGQRQCLGKESGQERMSTRLKKLKKIKRQPENCFRARPARPSEFHLNIRLR